MTRGVIEFDRVTKVYPGADSPAVQNLTLTIDSGEICAVVGPSGCGKTTVMRMVNRLHDPTSGEIRIDGVANTSMQLEELRRSIGYVIQQVGLFPHQTIADNVATVPRLLGWDEAIISRRTDELLEIVGLPAREYRDRYPAQLSGGQRQRVGVARALAADPPIMLMDEPFGAIDPVVRHRIQQEFLDLQHAVRKTIIIVTHDLDEAMQMGDKVLILKEGGILAQYSSPDELLAHPNSDFVRNFIGSDTGLRRLSLKNVAQSSMLSLADAAAQAMVLYVTPDGVPAHWEDTSPARGTIHTTMNLREALSEMLAHNVDRAAVTDPATGAAVGVVTVNGIRHELSLPPAAPTNNQAHSTG